MNTAMIPTAIDWTEWCMNVALFFSALVTMLFIYLSGRRDERVKSIRKITELRHICYKQQEMINTLTTERDVYRSGYDSMSKRVQRMDYHSGAVPKNGAASEERSRGEGS